MFHRLFLWTAAAVAVWTACWGPYVPSASAHPFNNGYSEVRLEQDQIYYGLFLPGADVPFVDQDGDGRITADELRENHALLEAYVADNLDIDNGDESMDFHFVKTESMERDAVPGLSMELLFTIMAW